MTTPVKIVLLDRDTLRPETTLRRVNFVHDLESHDRTAPDQTAIRIADAEIVITNKVRLTREAISAAPRLRMVAVAATGYDCVDIEACRERGIVVSNIRNYARNTVPEHVFAMIFALRRSLFAYRDAVLAGRWQEAGQFCFFDYPIRDLAGSTLGVIGGGALGSQVGAMGRALGMQVLFSGRKGEAAAEDRTPFETVLATSDVITLHCPLNDQTRGLIGDAEFAAMSRKPLLINTGRGGLVDEEALVRALDSGAIAGAGFDVTTPEPPPHDNPLMRLGARPNFILTPHVAWASTEAVQALADQLIENIEAFQAGEPRNRVV
jgi:glycerate dehydrogenase